MLESRLVISMRCNPNLHAFTCVVHGSSFLSPRVNGRVSIVWNLGYLVAEAIMNLIVGVGVMVKSLWEVDTNFSG